MARTTSNYPTTEEADKLPWKPSMSGSAELVISAHVRFENEYVLEVFVNWVADQNQNDNPIVQDFLEASGQARNEIEQIRSSINR